MLRAAVAGRATVDARWWAELAGLRVDVLVDRTDRVVGAVSFAGRARSTEGFLLWLHAREQRPHLDVLVRHVLDSTADRSAVHAFDFASPLSLGLEALPIGHRPVTRRALLDAGFVADDL
jgi:hypothetical protein